MVSLIFWTLRVCAGGWERSWGTVIKEVKVVKNGITKPAQLYETIRTFANKVPFLIHSR